MPTYDYACATCGPFSAVRRMAESADPASCPACGDEAPRAILSAPALGGNAQAPKDSSASNMRIHSGGCACCAPPRRPSAMVAS